MEGQPKYGSVNLERRKFPRINVDLPVEYYRIDPNIRYKVRVDNISEEGLLIYFPEPMKMGEHLRMKLFFVTAFGMNTIEMVGEGVWKDICSYLGQGDCRCGVKFIAISHGDIEKIKNFLRGLLN